MDEDSESGGETVTPVPQPTSSPTITLQKAVEMGEYDPEYLATFPDWHTLSKHIQFQYIQEALNNRIRQLDLQYAAVINVLDFSKKPHLQEALRNIEEQVKKVREDKEKLLLEYSQP